ncbi:ExeA family protein, partial [Pseudomonadota bacterium]
MYTAYFGLSEAPFSITPDPRYLYMSERHREAMAHLFYGLSEGGGFVQLTGEVGTGKTTLCRCMMLGRADNIDLALILNPRISELELLASICDELKIKYPKAFTAKHLLDRLNTYLLKSHADGRHAVVVIDEAQNLSREVLEQVRLLTNLETSKHKLLQIILIGQPELVTLLNREDLRQLAQRITARYHLLPLSLDDAKEYIKYRLKVAGCDRPLFTRAALRRVFRMSGGIPRLINIICDRALLGAYAKERHIVDSRIVSSAGKEVFGSQPRRWKF